ncbi:MAG: sigma factor [Anaeromassilibacillus sp.]
MAELWEAVRRFAHDRAYRWCRAMDGRAGMVLEDYIQVAFLALLDALEGWDPAAGAFLTWYSLKLKGAFTEAVGMRTQRDKRDPIHHALSLDAPFMDARAGRVYFCGYSGGPRRQ